MNTNIWKGRHFGKTGILILGESTYDDDDLLDDYIEKWIKRLCKPDKTFSRIFKACTGHDASSATIQQRREFWESVDFFNFVPDSVGPTNKSKATTVDFARAKKAFLAVLQNVKPKGVWILGKGQAEYSQQIVAEAGIPHEVVAHPTSYGISNKVLRESWDSFRFRLAVEAIAF